MADDRRGELCSPARKCNRLRGYDYSQQGAYFITVCVQNRAELFGRIVGTHCVRPYIGLSDQGQIVQSEIETLSSTYETVSVDAFVIMPNHVHMIIVIDSGRIQNGRPQVAPTVSRIIKQWKGAITKRLGFSPWQKSFHDHVIRGHEDYLGIAEYIENNPAQWEQDSLHPANNKGTP